MFVLFWMWVVCFMVACALIAIVCGRRCLWVAARIICCGMVS